MDDQRLPLLTAVEARDVVELLRLVQGEDGWRAERLAQDLARRLPAD